MSQDQKDFKAPSDAEPGRIQYERTAKIDKPSYAMTFAMCPRCGKNRQVDDSGYCRDCRKEFNAPSDVDPMPEKRKISRPEAIEVCGDILARAERERIESQEGCPRCGLQLFFKGIDTCPECGMTRPDPARQLAISKRIHQMRRIHKLERDMTDDERDEWIRHGFCILRRKDGNALVGILGDW